MKFKSIGYLTKQGLKGVFRHGFPSFAAVCVTVACLLIVGSFSCLLYNLNIMVQELNDTNEVLVYIDENLTDAEARSIGTQINRLDNIKQADFVHRDQAFENFVADYNDDSAFEGLESDIFQHRYVVKLHENRHLEKTMKELWGLEGVVDVVADDELAKGFTTIQDVLSIVSAVIIVVLMFVSLVIISNTVKIAMYDRKEEIGIMKMVGATNGFIRFPFVVEGFTLGMFSATLAFFAEWLMYSALVDKIATMDGLKLFEFQPFTELLLPMIAVFAGAGFFVGVIGSWFSIRKFMNV